MSYKWSGSKIRVLVKEFLEATRELFVEIGPKSHVFVLAYPATYPTTKDVIRVRTEQAALAVLVNELNAWVQAYTHELPYEGARARAYALTICRRLDDCQRADTSSRSLLSDLYRRWVSFRGEGCCSSRYARSCRHYCQTKLPGGSDPSKRRCERLRNRFSIRPWRTAA